MNTPFRAIACWLVVCTLAISAAPACAEDSWVFRRSYYSHHPAQPVQIGSRRSATGPFQTRPFGQYVNGGYRNLNSSIVIGGATVDHLNVWEGWYQVGTQY